MANQFSEGLSWSAFHNVAGMQHIDCSHRNRSTIKTLAGFSSKNTLNDNKSFLCLSSKELVPPKNSEQSDLLFSSHRKKASHT
jgi:hypothetical protein